MQQGGWRLPVCSDRADCGVFGGWPYLAYDFIKRLVRTYGSNYPLATTALPCPAPTPAPPPGWN